MTGHRTHKAGPPIARHRDREPAPEATLLMNAAAGSDAAALDRLLPLVYEQLRRAARAELAGERAGHTLSATALVHEAYLKLVGPRDVPWNGRAHFYSAAAEAMRRILIDHAKTRGRVKRGGGLAQFELDEDLSLSITGRDPEHEHASGGPDYVALDEAICRLSERDPRMGQVVRLRFYAGLGIAETALALGISERTVKNDWAFARAWLARELEAGEPGGAPSARDSRANEE